MKKKSADPGLLYIQKMGIRVNRSRHGIIDQLIRNYGRQRANEIFDELFPETDEEGGINYRLKNSDYDISMLVSGAYDGDIIRNLYNWVYKHQSYFGKSILEIGCDCGFVTCMLGTLFPDSKIVSIDMYPESIEVAKRNAERFGVTNIEFRCVDVKDLAETFDTVVSSRTLHENIDQSDIESFVCEPLLGLVEGYQNEIAPYATLLSNLISQNGHLISFERVGIEPFFLSWLMALNSAGLTPILETNEYMHLAEAAEESDFQALISQKGFATANETDLMQHYLELHSPEMRNKNQFTHWTAEVSVALNAANVISGYYILNEKTSFYVGKFVVYATEDPTTLLYYRNATERWVGIFDAAVKEELLSDLEKTVNHNLKLGFVAVPFTMEEGIEVKHPEKAKRYSAISSTANMTGDNPMARFFSKYLDQQ